MAETFPNDMEIHFYSSLHNHDYVQNAANLMIRSLFFLLNSGTFGSAVDVENKLIKSSGNNITSSVMVLVNL